MARNNSKRNGFTAEAMTHFMANMSTAIKKAKKDIDRRHVHFSSGNRKIGLVLNVSTAPVFTCGHCEHCRKFCYDIKACLQYVNTVTPARADNTALALYAMDRYFEEIARKMDRRRKNLYMRWHVGGEIINREYFGRMVDTCREHGGRYVAIWTYTKEHDLVNTYIRDHGGNRRCVTDYITVMFSHWYGTEINNPYNMPVFWTVKTPEDVDRCRADGVTWECPGNCDTCKAAGRGCVVGESVYAWLH